MSDSKYNILIQKIFWFALPLIISLLTFLVVNTYFVKEEVAKVAVKNETVVNLQEKMWIMIQENNNILKEKADKLENEEAHRIMFQKLDILQNKVDKIYTMNKINYSMNNKRKDSIFFTKGVWDQIVMNKTTKK